MRFPDRLHEQLYDLGKAVMAGEPGVRDKARTLYPLFGPYTEGIRSPRDMPSLAADYAAEIDDVATTGAKQRAGITEDAGFVISPDAQADYLAAHYGHEAAVAHVGAAPDQPVTVPPGQRFPGQPVPPEPSVGEPEAAPEQRPITITAGPPIDIGAASAFVDELGPPKRAGIKSVPRTQAQLENALVRAERTRNEPTASKALKAAAEKLQIDALNRLEDVKARLLATDYGRAQLQAMNAGLSYTPDLEAGMQPVADIEFRLRAARGQETVFRLKPDLRVLDQLIEDLRKKTALPKFYSQGLPPTAAAIQPGARYVGGRQDTVQGTPAPKSGPLRREDILRPLLKALGVPLYQGRMKGRKILGFYRRRIEEVRIKRMNDIETATHELAHALDDRIPEIRKQWFPASNANKTIRDELRGVSYDEKKLFEGFAELVRLWATQKEKAKAAAPNFYGWFEDFLTRSEYGPALRKAQQEMHQWFEQDAIGRARSKIGVTEEINAGLTTFWDRFRQGVTDDLHGIYNMERTLTGEISPFGAYETARLTRAKLSIIEGALLYGAPVVKRDGSHGFEGKSLTDILNPVANELDDALLYFVGRSANELRQQGREHLFSKAEIDGMLALKNPAFDTAFDEYQVWNKAILDFAQAKGAIDPLVRAMWKRTQYLPFHRVGQPGAFSPVPGDWKGIRALTGGTENLRDVLKNIVGNAAMLIDAGLTNEARLQVAELAKGPKGAHFMAKIPKEERVVKVHRDEVERSILDALGVKKKAELHPSEQAFVDQIVKNMGGMVPLVMRGQTPLGRNVVAVLKHGKPEYYEVIDPILYRALTRLKRPYPGWLRRFLGSFRRFGQLSITFWPDFMARNITRDTLMGFVMSRHGFKPVKDSAIGLVSRLTSDQNYRDFIANGGGFASYYTDEAAFKKHIERFYSRKGINYQTVLDSPAKTFYFLERIADAFEMSTRLGEFRQAVRRGEHPRHAAYSGREVSTDFAMRGDLQAVEFVYDTFIFVKAAMNSLDRLYRGVAHDPNAGAIAAKTALIGLLTMGLYLINRGNPDFEDLEDWDRETNWHFYIPTPETLDAYRTGGPLPAQKDRYLHFRYPRIWEIGSIASLAERTTERLMDEEPEKLGPDFARILMNNFRMEYVPQAFAPLYELAINRNRFTDRPIETEAMQELQPWARSGPGTSRTLRKIGEATRNLPKALQVPPAQAEALLRGYANSWAAFGLSMSDAIFFDDAPDWRLDQWPVVRAFFRQHPPRQTKYVTEFYDMLDAATQARRTMRHMDKTYRPDFAAELEFTPENLEFRQLSGASQSMRAVNAELRRVADTPTLPELHDYANDLGKDRDFRSRIGKLRLTKAWRDLGALKRDLLDLWIAERNDLAKRTVKDVEQQRRAAR